MTKNDTPKMPLRNDPNSTTQKCAQAKSAKTNKKASEKFSIFRLCFFCHRVAPKCPSAQGLARPWAGSKLGPVHYVSAMFAVLPSSGYFTHREI